MKVQTVGTGILAAAMGAVFIGGCSSTSGPAPTAAVQSRVNTVETIDEMRADLRRADAHIVLTQQSLDNLASQQAGDLTKTFDRFKSDVDKNEAYNTRINARANTLSAESYRHINDWNAQAQTIRDESLRQRSLERESQAKKEHDEMVMALNDLRGIYPTYIRQLQDVETYISNDLTPQGVATLKDQKQKVADAAQQLRQRMATLDQQLSRMASTWQSDVPLANRVRQEEARPAGDVIPLDTTQPANTPAAVD